jgi:hypothetical protein
LLRKLLGVSKQLTQKHIFLYGAIEGALAEVLDIPAEETKAFRARLRHLRDLGIPSALPRPGSGKKVAYSLSQALEMLFAIVLEHGGYSPRRAVSLVPSVLEDLKQIRIGSPNDDIYVIVSAVTAGRQDPYAKEGDTHLSVAFAPGFKRLTEVLKDRLVDRGENTLFVINASVLAAKVERTLLNLL